MDLRRQMQDKKLAASASAQGPDAEKLRRMFGNRNVEALAKKKTPTQRFLGQDRKYFDSGDWVLSKTGKSDAIATASLGSEHPVPEKIPHLSSPVVGHTQQHHHQPGHHHHHANLAGGVSNSPAKETSFLSQETRPEDLEGAKEEADDGPSEDARGAAEKPTDAVARDDDEARAAGADAKDGGVGGGQSGPGENESPVDEGAEAADRTAESAEIGEKDKGGEGPKAGEDESKNVPADGEKDVDLEARAQRKQPAALGKEREIPSPAGPGEATEV